MVPGLTSIVIPTYNHATQLADAIGSALLQTAPVEVIAIDDGSTDHTSDVLRKYPQVRALKLPHCGPSLARNAGLDAAAGEYVMLLDADDVIAPEKVAKQRAELEAVPEAGWCLCDVRIEDACKGRTINASEQYDYARIGIDGWIKSKLQAGPFIPVMSPLVRRSVIEEPTPIRFDDRLVPEDYHFWLSIAGRARVRYVPDVLATYRHGRTGRSRLPKTARAVEANIELPLRLNLGCGAPGTRSWHPMRGFVNLDKSMGWRFEDGLRDFADHSVAGITISHALMYLPEADWPRFLSECSRVLADHGVLRITEDHTEHPESARRGGWRGSEPAVTLTTPSFVAEQLARAGLVAEHVDAERSTYLDRSLMQAQHGKHPDVFFIEGRKLPGTLFSPHNDDETLFAAFTILRFRPRVVVCFESVRDYGDPRVRENETREAMTVLGGGAVEQWACRTGIGSAHVGELVEQMQAFDARAHPIRVWAPSREASHPDHVAVAEAAALVFDGRVRHFHTYDAGGKVRRGKPVEYEVEWIEQKHRALLRYETQIKHARAHTFFAWDLPEYEEA
jgi:glycosyltransferase involved in cell wall biosynthesis/LmbE family N-acetylglucosaminyl deacetylase